MPGPHRDPATNVRKCIEGAAAFLCESSRLNQIAGNDMSMTLDEKIRLGMLALAGASIVFASLGVHLGPLDINGGWGSH